MARSRLLLTDALEHGQRERSGLPGAGGGLSEQIASFEEDRDCFALNGRGLFVSKRGNGVGELLAEADARKSHSSRVGLHPSIMSCSTAPCAHSACGRPRTGYNS